MSERSLNPEDIPVDIQVLVVVDSWQGHTAEAAKHIVAGIHSAHGSAVFRTADDATRADLLRSDALIMGSAVHQRSMTWKMKRFVDEVCEPAWFYDDVVGRVGAVFSAGGGHGQAGGGAESAQIDMLANLAACGMILVPLPKCTPGFDHGGVHWGPTIKTTDGNMRGLAPETLGREALRAFFHHGANVVHTARRLRGVTLASGNGWPSPEDRAARAQFESDRSPDKRYPSLADPTSRKA